MSWRSREQLGAEIGRLRTERGIECGELARRLSERSCLDYSPERIERIERSGQGLSTAALLTVAEILEVDVEQLLRDDHQQEQASRRRALDRAVDGVSNASEVVRAIESAEQIVADYFAVEALVGKSR